MTEKMMKFFDDKGTGLEAFASQRLLGGEGNRRPRTTAEEEARRSNMRGRF
jgi:hypothetical protein